MLPGFSTLLTPCRQWDNSLPGTSQERGMSQGKAEDV